MDYLAPSVLQLAQSDIDRSPFPIPFVPVDVLEQSWSRAPSWYSGVESRWLPTLVLAHLSHLVHT